MLGMAINLMLHWHCNSSDGTSHPIPSAKRTWWRNANDVCPGHGLDQVREPAAAGGGVHGLRAKANAARSGSSWYVL